MKTAKLFRNGQSQAVRLPMEFRFEGEAARVYGQIRAVLEKRGTPIGALDMMTGAQALALGATLATNNTRDFSRISGLTVVDWLDGKR